MTRLERKNRTDIKYKGQGSIFDGIDDAVKETWRISDEEYDYLLGLNQDAEKYLLLSEKSTITEVKEAISFINKNLEKRY